MLACVNACFFPFRHYSWQTVHGLLLLPPEAVWRCAYISQLSQGWYLIFMDSYIIVVSFTCFYDTVHLTLSAFWPVKVYLVFMLLLGFFLQGYFYNDDTFNFNYAQAKAALGNYKEAEEVFHLSKKKRRKIWTMFCTFIPSYWHCWIFKMHYCSLQLFLLIQSEKMKNDYIYLSWLARCCTCCILLYFLMIEKS